MSSPALTTTTGLLRVRRAGPGTADALTEFLVADDWPFHAGGRPDRGEVLDRIRAGYYDANGTESYLFDDSDSGSSGGDAPGDAVAFVRLTDLLDDTAMFDVRVAGPWRGRGVGSDVVGWATRHVFTSHRHVRRVEATTRHDNLAMRQVLRRCGYVKECHYRASWPDREGRWLDGVGYAMLRADWRTGTTTEVRWDDEA